MSDKWSNRRRKERVREGERLSGKGPCLLGKKKTDCQTHTHTYTHTELNIATNRIIVLAVFTLRNAFFSLTRLSLFLPLFCHLPFSSVCRPPTENIHTHKLSVCTSPSRRAGSKHTKHHASVYI